MELNPDNSRAMSALTFLSFKLNILQTKIVSLSQPNPWCNESGVLNLHHNNDIKEVVSSQPSVTWYESTNQKIGTPTVYEIGIIMKIIACDDLVLFFIRGIE